MPRPRGRSQAIWASDKGSRLLLVRRRRRVPNGHAANLTGGTAQVHRLRCALFLTYPEPPALLKMRFLAVSTSEWKARHASHLAPRTVHLVGNLHTLPPSHPPTRTWWLRHGSIPKKNQRGATDSASEWGPCSDAAAAQNHHVDILEAHLMKHAQ